MLYLCHHYSLKIAFILSQKSSYNFERDYSAQESFSFSIFQLFYQCNFVKYKISGLLCCSYCSQNYIKTSFSSDSWDMLRSSTELWHPHSPLLQVVKEFLVLVQLGDKRVVWGNMVIIEYNMNGTSERQYCTPWEWCPRG